MYIFFFSSFHESPLNALFLPAKATSFAQNSFTINFRIAVTNCTI